MLVEIHVDMWYEMKTIPEREEHQRISKRTILWSEKEVQPVPIRVLDEPGDLITFYSLLLFLSIWVTYELLEQVIN